MRRLKRNLSRRFTPCVRVAAIVVSEINERLSPKNEPPTTAATSRASFMPVSTARPDATGVRATIVPTDVPTEIETKQAARKRPAVRYSAGRSFSVRFTVASIAPIASAEPAKAPARMKIQIICRMF